MSLREEGFLRKSTDDFGFHAGNRGTLGISPYHVHEVAWSCIGGVQAQRYKVVDAVRVPSSALDAWRLVNQQKCNSDMLMPKFSETMRFALLTKTHFIHANKLNNDGNRTLFNKGDVAIKFKMEGSEAKKIVEDGFCVCLYKEELWWDKEALNAIMRVDNEDADVQMKEDQMQFQGSIDEIITAMVAKGGVVIDSASVLKAVTAAGLKTFKPEEAQVFVDFRLAMSEGVGDFFLL